MVLNAYLDSLQLKKYLILCEFDEGVIRCIISAAGSSTQTRQQMKDEITQAARFWIITFSKAKFSQHIYFPMGRL